MGEEIGSHPHISFPICPLKGYSSNDSTGGNELSPASPSTLKSFLSKVTEMSVGEMVDPRTGAFRMAPCGTRNVTKYSKEHEDHVRTLELA